MRFNFGLVTLLLSLFVMTTPATATISIVATVNGQAITSYDVAERVKFLEQATDIAVTDDNRERVFDDALQMLVDDTLKIQAALAVRPGIESVALPRAKELIDEAYGTDVVNGMRALRNMGIDPLTVQSKFLSDLLWGDFLKFTYQEKFASVDDKIDIELERLIANASQPQVFLSEIVLAPSQTRNLSQTKALADEMVAAIRNGSNFAAIAEQYSAAGTASRGGRIGWVVTERLPDTFSTIVGALGPGEVSNPIELDGAVYIFSSNGKRDKGLADDSQARVWLARAILNVPADASNPDRLEAAARIERESASLNNCDALVALHEAYKSGAVARLNDMLVADLAPQMQRLVGELNENEPSEPLAFAEGVAVFMVCKRAAPDLDLPSRDEIRRIQIDKVFGAVSERHLLRLRRAAVIDIRG